MVSALALLVLSPLLLLIGILVTCDSPGPVIFRQARMGRGGRLFQIYKFRTMIDGAQATGPAITVGRDARVTRAGAILRRFDLDELPSLFNVLKGDMSIVGPRPELPRYLPRYSEAQKRVFAARPGLTDPATLAFRHEAALLSGDDAEEVYVREILPRKLALSVGYVESHGFLSDLRIILQTLAAVVTRRKG